MKHINFDSQGYNAAEQFKPGQVIIARSWWNGNTDMIEWYISGSMQSHIDTYGNFVKVYGHGHDDDINSLYVK